MNLPKTSGQVIWLLPCPEQSLQYGQFIRQLARQFNSPEFLPHITLSKVPSFRRNSIEFSLHSIAERLSPLDVNIAGPVCGENPYQKVTLPLDDVMIETKVCDLVDRELDGAYSKRAGFHLSLLYSSVSCRSVDLARIERQMPKFKKLYIQEIVVAEIESTPGKWRLLARRNL